MEIILKVIFYLLAAGLVIFLFGCCLAMFFLGIYKESENGVEGRTRIEDSGMETGTREDAKK